MVYTCKKSNKAYYAIEKLRKDSFEMNIKDLVISEQEIQNVLNEAVTGTAASLGKGNACSLFHKSRPLILTGVAILNFIYPPAAGAISAIVAIMDKACNDKK